MRVWPRFGESPHDDTSRRDYFDSIYHASAVVGINTTAQIESAIVGRPVHTILAEEFSETQQGTLHFRYLEAAEFGLLHVGRTWDEHARAAGGLAPRRGRRRAERAVPEALRPAARARPARNAAPRRCDRGARRKARPGAGTRARPTRRSSAGSPRGSRPTARSGRKCASRSPVGELRRTIDRLASGDAPILAGPWTGDEIGELLYWIPFLRWVQTANIGLRERLYVPRAPQHEVWYAGIGAGTEAPEGAKRLDPQLVLAARSELARQDPGLRIQHRLLEFAPLPGAGPYEGPYGVEAYLAVLAGQPARATGAENADPDDLLVAESFLARPPFGRLEVDRPRAAWERLTELEEYEALTEMRSNQLVPVREPLVLISQIQRSGGTLLSQLFDGHPEVHAHPHEICIGKPDKWDWPPLDLGAPETWFATLHEPLLAEWIETGFVKDLTELRKQRDPDVFPFVFSLKLQRAIFERCAAGATTEREVLDAYFTSYFNAWLDNHNLYTGAKKAVVGFTPRLAMELDRVERFFAAYPDGLLVSIVRDPRGWYASARRHRKYYADLEQSLGLWRASTESALEAADRHGDRVVVLTYEALLDDPEAAMSTLAARIGIEMAPDLLVPTFNSRPIRANSSDAVERTGILPERRDAFRDVLTADELGQIERLAGDLYERATPVSFAT